MSVVYAVLLLFVAVWLQHLLQMVRGLMNSGLESRCGVMVTLVGGMGVSIGM